MYLAMLLLMLMYFVLGLGLGTGLTAERAGFLACLEHFRMSLVDNASNSSSVAVSWCYTSNCSPDSHRYSSAGWRAVQRTH
jgi:hypothetical protein